jgi:hypothetical protein
MKNWGLNAKIGLLIGLMSAASLGIGGLGLTKMHEINDALEGIVTGPANRLNRAHTLKELFLIQQINQKNFILETSKDGMDQIAAKIEERAGQIKEKLASYLLIARPVIKPKLEEFSQVNESWLEANRKLMALSREGKN